MHKESRYIYNVNFQGTDRDISALEIKVLFNKELNGKAFMTSQKRDPSISPYIKNRLDVILEKDSFEEIIEDLEENIIEAEEFKVIYLKLVDEDIYHEKRRYYSKEVGMRIMGFPLFVRPKITFAVSFYMEKWYLSLVNENTCQWKKHNNKPYSYSSSLSINIAKVLVNLASEGDSSKSIIDPCCGVGTVLLEGLFQGYDIYGRELNEKISENARKNLEHYGYPQRVDTGDIRDIEKSYDSSIIDLPYGISVETSKDYQMMILKSARKISEKLVIVSSEDIRDDLLKENFNIIDKCKVTKNKNREFSRYIWICK